MDRLYGTSLFRNFDLLLSQRAFPLAEGNNNVQAILGMGAVAKEEKFAATETLG